MKNSIEALKENPFAQQHPTLLPSYAGSILFHSAKLHPNNIALVGKDQEKTYEQIAKEAAGFSIFLMEKGVESRQPIILLCENSLQYYSAYYGIWQTGAIIVPVNTFLHENELAYIISDCEPQAIVVSSKMREKVKNTDVPVYTIENVMASSREDVTNFKPFELEPDELSAILYTSGTTGFPKGVMMSSQGILTNVMQGGLAFSSTFNQRALAILPLFHSYMQNTCVWAAMMVGATVIVVPKIDRSSIMRGLAQKPTVILGIPPLYGLFCLLKKLNFDSVEFFICGGDALPDKIKTYFALIYRRSICNGYGLTEAGPFVSINMDEFISPTNTVGRPLYQVEIELRDEEGKVVPWGTIGTLWIRGKNLMLGYYKAAEATEKIMKAGWLNTGDLAYQTPDNKMVICGREKDLIINKGIKIYPQEIENILLSHADVMNAAVVGLIDHEEEVPVAFVSLQKDATADENKLIKWCQQHLAGYKVPRQIFIEKELPVTATGKVDKKPLKARLKKEKS
jgi:long-chain acyl-CoA synthetase